MSAFMIPQYHEGEIVSWETSDGVFYIPAEHYEESFSAGAESVVRSSGALSRLSAPGYLDCTDWSPSPTLEEARKHLSETYEVCADCGEDLDESVPADSIACADCA